MPSLVRESNQIFIIKTLAVRSVKLLRSPSSYLVSEPCKFLQTLSWDGHGSKCTVLVILQKKDHITQKKKTKGKNENQQKKKRFKVHEPQWRKISSYKVALKNHTPYRLGTFPFCIYNIALMARVFPPFQLSLHRNAE